MARQQRRHIVGAAANPAARTDLVRPGTAPWSALPKAVDRFYIAAQQLKG
jgi:hypothetical protein